MHDPAAIESTLRFLAGGGEMGARIRAFDWTDHPLGPPASWPPGLRTAVRLMLTTLHPIFVFWGPELVCFYNDAYRRSLGPEKHPAMLGGRGREHWDEIWPIIGPQIEAVLAGGSGTWPEDQLVPITRFGRREDVYWTYSYGPIDEASAPRGVGGVLVICTETTEKVRLGRRLSDEAEHLRRLFEQAPSFIAELRGPEHRFTAWNAAYHALVGHRPLDGMPVAQALPEARDQGYVALLDRVYESGVPYVGEGARFELAAPPGGTPRTVYVDFIYQPIRGADGCVEGIFVVGHDVTGQHRSLAALREADARKNEFLAMLAHELRNPLAPIRNATHLLEHEALSERGRRALAMSRRQLVHLARLVDDLLEVSRVTRGLIDLRPEPLVLQQVLRGVVDGLAPVIDERGLRLVLEVPQRPLRLLADPVRLAQVLENLMTNACKYTDRGGRIELCVHEDGDRLEIGVRDDGIGIAADHLPRIFELFAQVDSAIDRARGGLGIGLYLVRRLVELHGGTVSAHSDGPGTGARFAVRLPVAPPGARPDNPGPGSGPGPACDPSARDAPRPPSTQETP